MAAKGQKVCVHTHIVGLVAMGYEYGCRRTDEEGEEQEQVQVQEQEQEEEQGASDAAVERRDEGCFDSASLAFEKNPQQFASKIYQLMKIAAVYAFPPDPLLHLPPEGAQLLERFTVREQLCTQCLLPYQPLADQTALAITQVQHPWIA